MASKHKLPKAEDDEKVKKKRIFRPEWLNDPVFNTWLHIQQGTDTSSAPKLCCSICIKAGIKNVFTSGCTEYQRSAFTNHMSSKGHVNAVSILKCRENMRKAINNQEKKSEDGLESQLRTAYFIAEKNLAITLFDDLCELQQSNNTPFLQSGSWYKSYEPVAEMIKCIADSVDDNMKDDISKSKYIGLMTDESIDIAVLKKMVLYIKIVKNGEAKVFFVANVTVPDGKAETIFQAILEWLESNNIDVDKVMALGSDGAAVMMGVRNGVGKKFKDVNAMLVHIHCYAHRLALAVSQASFAVEQLKTYQETVNSIYFYFHNSAQRYNKLREIYSLLEDDNLISLKQPHSVRWLSLHQAVEAIEHCWPALVMALGQEAASGNATAKGLVAKVEDYKFIGLTCLLYDVLPNFTRLSKIFQRNDLDFATAATALQTIRATLTTMADVDQQAHSLPSLQQLMVAVGENQPSQYRDTTVKHCHQGKLSVAAATRTFLQNLIENIAQRFPEETEKILKALDKILNPKNYPQQLNTIAAYAVEDIELLIAHYRLPDAARCRQDFLAFKHFVVGHKDRCSFADFCKLLINEHHDEFPDFANFACIAIVIPLNSASCERGFSAQNNIKTNSRSRLGDDQVERLMKISVNGPHFAQFDYTDAKQKFRAMKNRKM